MKVDVEVIIDAIYDILQANLNTKIAEIDAEKTAGGKGLDTVLAPIDTAAYFLQSWNDAILNYHPAIFYGAEILPTIDGPIAGIKATLFIDVIYQDDGNRNNDTWRRVNRYTRAVKEVIEANAGAIPGASRLKVETVRPESFRLAVDSSEEIKVCGVSITASFA